MALPLFIFNVMLLFGFYKKHYIGTKSKILSIILQRQLSQYSYLSYNQSTIDAHGIERLHNFQV